MSSAIVTLDTLEMDWWLHELGDSFGKGLEGLKDEQLLIALNDAETLTQTINKLFEQFIALNISPNAIRLAPLLS